MAPRNDTFVTPFFELLRKKSSYHIIPDGRRIRQLNLLTLGNYGPVDIYGIKAVRPDKRVGSLVVSQQMGGLRKPVSNE